MVHLDGICGACKSWLLLQTRASTEMAALYPKSDVTDLVYIVFLVKKRWRSNRVEFSLSLYGAQN